MVSLSVEVTYFFSSVIFILKLIESGGHFVATVGLGWMQTLRLGQYSPDKKIGEIEKIEKFDPDLYPYSSIILGRRLFPRAKRSKGVGKGRGQTFFFGKIGKVILARLI